MRVSGADGLRGCATVMVAVGHAWFLSGMATVDHGPARAWIAATSVAVDLFFVLSGLVLLAPAAAGAEFGTARAFYRRRVARVYPLYVVGVVVGILVSAALRAGAPLPPSPAGWRDLALHLLLLQNPVVADRGLGFGSITVIWTLGVEAGFYLVLPWVARWWLRHPWLGLTAAWGLSRAWTSLALTHAPHAHLRLLLEMPTYAVQFGTGMTLAVVLHQQRYRALLDVLRGKAPLLMLAGCWWLVTYMVFTGSRDLAGRDGPYAHVVATQPALPGIALLVCGAALRPTRLLDGRLAAFLAKTSYGVYMSHLLLIRLAAHYGLARSGSDATFVLMLLGPVALSLGVAAASYRWLEQPARAWINRTRPQAPVRAVRPVHPGDLPRSPAASQGEHPRRAALDVAPQDAACATAHP